MTAAFALCGVVTYAALIPGHIVSQVITDLVKSEFGDAIEMICHTGDGAADKSQSPGKVPTHCPFCTGFAAFQIADLASAVLIASPPDRAGDAFVARDDAWSRGGVLTAKSRGPPSLPA